METSKIELLLKANNLPFEKGVKIDYIEYALLADSNRIKLKIFEFKQLDKKCFSIIINNDGRYIDYECYKNSEEFLEDLILLLKSKIEFTSVGQGSKILKNVFKVLYPHGSALETYTVTEKISNGKLFHKKQCTTHIFEPWIG